MSKNAEVIETTASQASAELARHGVDPNDPITITIEENEIPLTIDTQLDIEVLSS